MSIAVEPSKKKPYGREPLHINTPLPSRWGDCYHYALDHLLVRIPHVPVATQTDEISQSEITRHLHTIQKDLRRRVAKEHNYRLDHMGSPSDATPAAIPTPQSDSEVSLMEMQSDPIMSVRIPHDIDLLAKVPSPEEFIQQQWYLTQMQVFRSSLSLFPRH